MDSDIRKLRIDKDLKAGSGRGGSWLVAVGLLMAAAALGAFWMFLRSPRELGREVAVIRVEVPANAGSEAPGLEGTTVLSATGYVIAARKIEVASKVVGRVAWVGVERGDRVAAGQPLVRLEDEEYRARLLQQEGLVAATRAQLAELEAGSREEEIAQSRAQLQQALVELDNAEISLRRLRELQPTRAISRQQLDDAEALVRSRQAQVESVRQRLRLVEAGPRREQIEAQRALLKQAEGGLALAQIDLNNTVIRAPIGGTILERNVEVGEFVTTGFVGDRGARGFVVSLADLNDLEVELDIAQNDFARVSLGQPAVVTTDAYPDRRYRGVVSLISPEANRQKATVEVRVKVQNPDELLKPNMNATVAFLRPGTALPTTPGMQRPPVRIPRAALLDAGTVLVVEMNRVERRSVVVGDDTDGWVEIRRGLSGGELVVSDPKSVVPGEMVRPILAPADPTAPVSPTTPGSTTRPAGPAAPQAPAATSTLNGNVP